MIDKKHLEVAQKIRDLVDCGFSLAEVRSVTGGCIHEAYLYTSSSGEIFFIKLNQVSFLEHFKQEAFALKAIQKTQTIRTPMVLGWGSTLKNSFLALEYIDMNSTSKKRGQSILGEHLAAMHQTLSDRFGWFDNNFIGATPQINPWSVDWVEFYTIHRLEYQFRFAQNSRGYSFKKSDALLSSVPDYFKSYKPVASLLHGDLWSGNVAFQKEETPVIYDPACFYGDRECEIAFTQMFGGFDSSFYLAYENRWPLDSGFKRRIKLYNLYHYLNHFNLFGPSYLDETEQIISILIN